MACVILPSETARLVYGYLVKENLQDIAMQFLERSPYLTDCYQIVKNGYQFNTKLMGKELQDLLQEYSVIHNLVNNKVSLLSKSSLLYKRIKLRCETLSEILELILFWKYKNPKNNDNSVSSGKNEKSINSLLYINSNELKDFSDLNCNKNGKENIRTSVCHNSDSFGEVSPKINESDLSENLAPKSIGEGFLKSNEMAVSEASAAVVDEVQNSDHNKDQENITDYVSVHVSRITEEFQSSIENLKKKSDEICNVNVSDECSPSTNNVQDASMSELCLSASVLTIDINSQNKDLVPNEPVNELIQTNKGGGFENQIKIVRIEVNENDSENQVVSSYSQSSGQTQENVTLGNSSVVFVGPEVNNVNMDQDRNQIIVIPIDYYKSQQDATSEMAIGEPKGDYFQSKEIGNKEKSEAVFEGIAATAISSTNNINEQLYAEQINNKCSSVDENILTESDFLRNRHLMYNVEKELALSSSQPKQSISLAINQKQNQSESISVQPVAAPLIVLSQAVAPTKQPSRFRSILPKKKNPIMVPPVVVVQPLVESNQGSKTRVSTDIKISPKKEDHKKVKKKIPLVQKSKNNKVDSSKSLSMPSIKTPVQEKNVNDSKSDSEAMTNVNVMEQSVNESEVKVMATEEKENLQETETKKIETPVFVPRRNSKRLSLSTPRRRSHIRALEFETPPKIKEGKKSRTSPKAKVEQITIERKSVRNTLFKSPIPETTFKSPGSAKGNKKITPSNNAKAQDTGTESLNELSIPIATRSPNVKLSDAWEDLTGVGCVIGKTEIPKVEPTKKMWDADLRCFIGESGKEGQLSEKKRIKKPERMHRDNRKNVKKKPMSSKKSRPSPIMVSPSKMSLTAKRNTYSINGNEGSPVRSLLDDLKLVTPFKDVEAVRPTEETPLTKLLRENINNIDIDLSMINTPSFPPTPSIVITPDLDDISLISGANYYSPSKDFSKDKVVKITDYFRVGADNVNKKDTKEMQEKVIDDLVSKAKEIIGIGKENQDENGSMRRRPSGKILSMVKIQMLTQCDKKLCENIPINEETNFQNTFSNNSESATPIEEPGKLDLKEELEEKRKRALRKIKVVKENLCQTRNRVTTRSRKRKRSSNASSKSDKSKSDVSSDAAVGKHSSGSDESVERRKVEVFHSTPYAEKKGGLKFDKTDSDKKVDNEVLEDIRLEFPPFENDGDQLPEVTEKTRKKLHYVKHFLKLDVIQKFINEFSDKNPGKLFLKPSLRRFFQVFYKWLKHPHKHELNASENTKNLLKEYLTTFNKINVGLNHNSKNHKKTLTHSDSGKRSVSDESQVTSEKKSHFSDDDDDKNWKTKGNDRKKDEDTEDGFVSILPLKKRKSTVQRVEIKAAATTEKNGSRNCSADNVAQTQNFLQDIDVDRFLSQIHGHGNR